MFMMMMMMMNFSLKTRGYLTIKMTTATHKSKPLPNYQENMPARLNLFDLTKKSNH